ncbi:MAG: P-loop NTPase fold protein, partial [Pseudanabaena sp.]
MFKLSEYFQLDRRYARSINLERDLDNPNSVEGYVLTDRSLYALKQILVNCPEDGQTHAVTLTGVYGTGKSAFAHFLACLCAGEESVKQKALAIAKTTLTAADFQKLHQNLPEKGCFRAIATAQREPLSHTIIRALDYGASRFWNKSKSKRQIVTKLVDLAGNIAFGDKVDSKEALRTIQEVITSAQTDVILIIDELGKNLEYASLHPSESDLYLLQQLAELKPNQENLKHSLDFKFYLIGLLHQSFADYGERLASLQRNEWAKIQGRFQDIPFTESPRQMTWLIGKAIARPDHESADKSIVKQVKKYDALIKNQAKDWCEVLRSQIDDISPELLAAAYPLHPIAALVLPIL